MSKKRATAIRWIKRAVLVVVCVWIVLYGIPRIILYRQLLAARGDNIPTQPDQLVAIIKPREGENAATDYRLAIPLVDKAVQIQGRSILVDTASLPVGHSVKLTACWKKMQSFLPSLSIAERATQKTGLDFARNWKAGYALETPELHEMHFMALLECSQCAMYAAVGDNRDAIHHFKAAETIIDQIGGEPDFQAELIYVNAKSDIDRFAMHLVETGNRDPKLLAGLDDSISHAAEPKDLAFYAEGELVSCLETIRQLPDMDQEHYADLLSSIPDPMERKRAEGLLKLSFMNPLYQAEFIGYYRKVIGMLRHDSSDWRKLSAAGSEADKMAVDSAPSALCVSLFARPIFGLCASMSKSLARTRLADTAARLILDADRTGSLPEKLPDYGAFSVDPFSGAPLVYKPTGTGFRLYSVGQNQTGDGVHQTENLLVLVPPEKVG